MTTRVSGQCLVPMSTVATIAFWKGWGVDYTPKGCKSGDAFETITLGETSLRHNKILQSSVFIALCQKMITVIWEHAIVLFCLILDLQREES